MSDQPAEPEFGLVMPFNVCASKGGPYDDDAYVAGYEAGLLDAQLEHQRPATIARPIHAGNMPQMDLIAMRHDYWAEFGEESDGWVFMDLTRSGTDGVGAK